jgi:hypothetical protein
MEMAAPLEAVQTIATRARKNMGLERLISRVFTSLSD